MSVNYAVGIKRRRMEIVRDALAGGRLYLLERQRKLCDIPLADGEVEGDALSFPVAESIAMYTGRPDNAVMMSADGQIIVFGLTVGDIAKDIEIDPPIITEGRTVRLISAKLRHG